MVVVQTRTRFYTELSVASTVGSATDLLRCEVCVCVQGAALLIINSGVGFGIGREEGSSAQPAVSNLQVCRRERGRPEEREYRSI